VFHAIRFGRTHPEAFELGIQALKDTATLVRYRACGLLAYSLRREAIPYLKELLQHEDPKTVEDAKAAIDAIQHRNHHYFVDRSHSGHMFWQVDEGGF
jgi:HEAT repeat protein